MDKGLLHIYSGEGVGKTTASVGLAIRAAGNNMKVVFCQFMKGAPSGEIEVLKKIPEITVFRNDIDFGFSPTFTDEKKSSITSFHNATLEKAMEIMKSEVIDLLILDEINPAYELELVDREFVKNIVLNRDEHLEIVMTGRNPDAVFMEKADYISEIACVKHPFYNGVKARKGIEF